ncbi:hypothetical protein SAMN04487866_12230 [Thermoactinomyces sp. DSM 45891]|uniref:hypothetical protein n=1 Tax=Thermoactinomyces sp. DSM 45891 TaxID=1761907 RepID=UPI00090F7A41|nr:hypothetical protein [Thermoactinomyces sp. DSM 45891]SFX75064.1 hypothetical protein SAMN04487866_12230 [Thermoactinomyces sp. DSM 45891]
MNKQKIDFRINNRELLFQYSLWLEMTEREYDKWLWQGVGGEDDFSQEELDYFNQGKKKLNIERERVNSALYNY